MRPVVASLLVAAATASSLAVAVTPAAAQPGSASATTRCPSRAVLLKAAQAQNRYVVAINPRVEACSGTWATSGASVRYRGHTDEVTLLFRQQRGRWVSVDRVRPCRAHQVPRALYHLACETN